MISLAIECSSKIASIAIFECDLMRSYIESANPKSHSEFINPAIDHCLKEAGLTGHNLDRICVSKGPGSFTGVRVGIALAKTFSYSLKIPIFAVNSLHVLAKNLHSAPGEIIVPVVNAQKNLLFWAAYAGDDEVISPNCSSAQEIIHQLADLKKPIRFLGDGFEILADSTKAQENLKDIQYSKDQRYPSAKNLGTLGIHWAKSIQPIDWKMLHPLYIRDSEAEENLRSRQKVSQ